MRIPDGPSGDMTVSATQLRVFGAGGFRLDAHEDSKGCPRRYHAQYVEKRVEHEPKSYALRYGSYFHRIMELMEDPGLTPDEALQEAFPSDGDPEMITEAKADLTAYMERGATPSDLYGTLAVEAELDAILYEDEEHGPVRYRGFIDWIGLDMDDPHTLHVVDYKSMRQPPSLSAVEGDVQLKSYAWLATECADRFGIAKDRVRVVVHLDAIKFREVVVEYSREEIEDWRDWAVAVCRTILRDEEADPRINAGCDWCPVRFDCPAYDALPGTAEDLAKQLTGMDDPEKRLAWRDAANSVRLLLEKQVKEIDKAFQQQAMTEGTLQVGDSEWVIEQQWSDRWDLPALHAAMGDAFYRVVNPVKTRVKAVTKDWEPSAVANVNAAVERAPGELKAKRRERSTDD